MQLLLQGRKLKVATGLEHARTLLEELQHFQIKSVLLKADAEIEWRERTHEDLVVAVTIAAWQAERSGVGFLFAVFPEEPIVRPCWMTRW